MIEYEFMCMCVCLWGGGTIIVMNLTLLDALRGTTIE